MRSDFAKMIEGYGLTLAEITYRIPDHLNFFQIYVWQDYDVQPDFPVLKKFLDFWTRELDGPLYEVRITHSGLIKPIDFKINRFLN